MSLVSLVLCGWASSLFMPLMLKLIISHVFLVVGVLRDFYVEYFAKLYYRLVCFGRQITPLNKRAANFTVKK